jgi:hypothetical protein
MQPKKQMYEYTLSFIWSINIVHANYSEAAEKYILHNLHQTKEWFCQLLGTIDVMFYSNGLQKDVLVTYLSHKTDSSPFMTVVSIQTHEKLDEEQKQDILYQIHERILSYIYCPYGPVYARPIIHSEVISLDLDKASLALVQ